MFSSVQATLPAKWWPEKTFLVKGNKQKGTTDHYRNELKKKEVMPHMYIVILQQYTFMYMLHQDVLYLYKEIPGIEYNILLNQ